MCRKVIPLPPVNLIVLVPRKEREGNLSLIIVKGLRRPNGGETGPRARHFDRNISLRAFICEAKLCLTYG